MSNQQQVTADGAPVNTNQQQQQQQQYPQMVMQQSVNAVPQQPLYNDQAQRYPPQQQQQQYSNESSPTRPSADAAALQAHQQRPSAQNQQQPQQPQQQMQQTQQMQQQQHFPRGGNTAPSQSGQNGPQGPPVMSQNGRKKIYQIRGAPFEVDPHFEIIKAIGVGAYGLVCSATDTVNKRYVAIKKMPKLFEDLIDGRRVLRELRILRWLGHHPNILQYYGVSRPRELSDQERNTFREVYFVTELLDADLSQLLISRQRLSIEHHAFMTFQLLCSLAYMHNANVIHRDLKPSNILVNANCELRLCDFGLSRANVPFGMMTQVNNANNSNGNGDGDSNSNQQQPQVVGGEESVGEDPLNSAKKSRETIRFNNPFNDGSNSSPSSTPVAFELTEYVVTRWYRPPELLLGIGYHHAVDLWSIGCILMEIITRRPLFAGSDYLNQLEKIAEIVPMPAPHDVPSMLMRTKNVEPARCIDNLRVMWNQSHYARPSRSMPDLEQVMEKFNYPQVVRRLMRLIKLPPDHAQPSMPMAKAVDLIAQLLTFHMGLRPTALQALRHPFLALHANDQIIEQKTKFSPEHVQNCLSQYQSIPAHQRGGAGAFQAFFSGRSNAPPFDMWAFDRQSRVHENELRAEFWVDMCMNN